MNILIAEDDADIRNIFVEILEDHGHQCTAAEDGEVAKNILEGGKAFDLLISDFRMPRMSGDELLEWCRQAGLKFPVIFVTANSALLSKETLALGDCCADLLRKPIGAFQLLQAVEAAKARSHAVNCLPPGEKGQ